MARSLRPRAGSTNCHGVRVRARRATPVTARRGGCPRSRAELVEDGRRRWSARDDGPSKRRRQRLQRNLSTRRRRWCPRLRAAEARSPRPRLPAATRTRSPGAVLTQAWTPSNRIDALGVKSASRRRRVSAPGQRCARMRPADSILATCPVPRVALRVGNNRIPFRGICTLPFGPNFDCGPWRGERPFATRGPISWVASQPTSFAWSRRRVRRARAGTSSFHERLTVLVHHSGGLGARGWPPRSGPADGSPIGGNDVSVAIDGDHIHRRRRARLLAGPLLDRRRSPVDRDRHSHPIRRSIERAASSRSSSGAGSRCSREARDPARRRAGGRTPRGASTNSPRRPSSATSGGTRSTSTPPNGVAAHAERCKCASKEFDDFLARFGAGSFDELSTVGTGFGDTAVRHHDPRGGHRRRHG